MYLVQCSAECDKLKGEKFAQECEKGGGFFKCCIRFGRYHHTFLQI